MDFLGKLLGGQDIQLQTDPKFVEAFVLQGDDAEKTQVFFNSSETRAACLAYKDIDMTIEADGEGLLIALPQSTLDRLAMDIDNALSLYNAIAPKQ